MFLLDIKNQQSTKPIGTNFVGIGFQMVIITSSEIQKVSSDKWESYLATNLKPRMVADGQILVFDPDTKQLKPI